MISDAVKRLARAIGLERPEPPKPPPKQARTAILRPQDPALSIRRLAEWEAIMDRALDAPSLDRDKKEADAVWLAMKREQPWTFLGWLHGDKDIVDDAGAVVGQAQPGDLHEPESKLKDWGR